MTDWPEAREGWRDSFPPTIALADLYLRLYGSPDEVIATSHCDHTHAIKLPETSRDLIQRACGLPGHNHQQPTDDHGCVATLSGKQSAGVSSGGSRLRKPGRTYAFVCGHRGFGYRIQGTADAAFAVVPGQFQRRGQASLAPSLSRRKRPTGHP